MIKNNSEYRMRLLETMVRDLEKTLEEVKKLVERYRHLGEAMVRIRRVRRIRYG